MKNGLQGGVQVPTGGNHREVRAREPKGRIPVRFRSRRYSPDGRRCLYLYACILFTCIYMAVISPEISRSVRLVSGLFVFKIFLSGIFPGFLS